MRSSANRLVLLLLALVSGAAACADSSYSMLLTFEPPELVDNVDKVQITLVDSCAVVRKALGEPAEIVRDQFTLGRITPLEGGRALEPGLYGFYAVGFQGYGECRIAAGCSEATVVAGGKGIVHIRMEGITPIGCNVETDGGVRDAGEETDAGEDIDASECTGPECVLHATQVALGALHACALRTDESVACWGDNLYGQIGTGAVGPGVPMPSVVAGLANIKQIVGGGFTTCARRGDGVILCWGDNLYGALGSTGVNFSTTPRAVDGLTGVRTLGAAAEHKCAILDSGRVKCWGWNEDGALGRGSFGGQSAAPAEVLNLENVVQVGGGYLFGCARTEDAKLHCWGRNDFGQLGDNTTTRRAEPQPVPGLTEVADFAPGGGHVCAIRESGEVLCWGDGRFDQILRGPGATSAVPVTTGIINGATMSAGNGYVCMLRADEKVSCWGGDNVDGELGNGTTLPMVNPPTIVTGLTDATGIALGYGDAHMCAIHADHRVVCWGENRAGQLGIGSITSGANPVPLEVLDP